MGSLLGEEWKLISKILNLKVIIPYKILLNSGKEIVVDVLLEEFGFRNGMLLLTDYNLIREYQNEIVDLKYGFSCLSEPTTEEIDRKKRGISNEELNLYKELLYDWSYCGKTLNRPKWWEYEE